MNVPVLAGEDEALSLAWQEQKEWSLTAGLLKTSLFRIRTAALC